MTHDEIAAALTHPPEWHEARRQGIGGSDAARVMAGEWRDLWAEKTGRKQPEDLSDNLAVQMGTWTEALNRYWFTKQTGIKLLDLPVHPRDWWAPKCMQANFDGITDDNSVFEAKHVSAYSKDDNIVARYYPQCQHLMAVSGLPRCYLSVFFGNSRWEVFTVDRDKAYIDQLVQKCLAFWLHVIEDTEPADGASEAPPVIAFDAMREVDMTGNNAWASGAHDWTSHRVPAALFADATKVIKALVDDDVKIAIGHGIIVTRSKSGSLTIKEAK